MRSFAGSRALVPVLLAPLLALVGALAGCESHAVYDCPEEGAYVEAGVGRYCAYGVVIGGFSCPDELPHRYDFPGDPPGVPPGFVCSDRPIGSPDDVPMEVCVRVPACGAPMLSDAGPTDAGIPVDGSVDASGEPPDAVSPPSMCARLGGLCTLPGGFPPTVMCPSGYAAVPGSETGLGGYRQLGCGNTEAGPFACCLPAFDCGSVECPVTELCVGHSGGPSPDAGAPGETLTCQPRPSECADAMDCAMGACADQAACITAACGAALPDAAIEGSTIHCNAA